MVKLDFVASTKIILSLLYRKKYTTLLLNTYLFIPN